MDNNNKYEGFSSQAAMELYHEVWKIQEYNDLYKNLQAKKNHPDFYEVWFKAIGVLLDFLVQDRVYYRIDKDSVLNSPGCRAYVDVVSLVDESQDFFDKAIAAFWDGDYKKAKGFLKKYINNIRREKIEELKNEESNIEDAFCAAYLEPFKDGWKFFYKDVKQYYKSLDIEVGSYFYELCDTFGQYYQCPMEDHATKIEILLDAFQNHMDSNLLRAFLGYEYFFIKSWSNSIAYFESVDTNVFDYVISYKRIWSLMGNSYYKIKNYPKELEYYKKVYDIDPDYFVGIRNLLGLAYYDNKDYDKALELFEECISRNDYDLKNAVNNKVRTLIAMHRYKDAKAFVKNAPSKVSKYWIDRLSNKPNINEKSYVNNKQHTKVIHEIEMDYEPEDRNFSEVDYSTPEQFSSEKVLEDEIEARLNAGATIFGVHLRIYNKKGDLYGRQYVIPDGRIDILAVDDDNNFYVIELKKDSGYDDPYDQLVEYMNWIKKNKATGKQKVYGIICLNNPKSDLIEKVKTNSMISLFQYEVRFSKLD